MQALLKRWTHALLEWLGVTSSSSDAMDRWVAFALVVLTALLIDLFLQLIVVRGIRRLVERLLQPLRDRLGEPIAILSGYRSDELNRLVGGVPSSQHRLGEAADCYCAAGPDHLLKVLKASGLPFDQAIIYCRRQFLHLSYREGRNRGMVIYK